MEDTLSTPAYARVRDRLRRDILAGEWPPGEHRRLAQLARHYGVSMIPVREALLGLEGEGLVHIRQHRGAVVPLLDAGLLDRLYDLRATLQGLLARRAAERAGAAELHAIAGHVEAFAAATDAAKALRHNEALHAAIDAAAQNPEVAAILAARTAFVTAARLRLGYGPARLAEAAREHGKLLAALLGRDGEAASRLAFEHAQSAKRDLLARIQGTPEP